MTSQIDAEQVRTWIDNELIESVEPMPDEAAVFNLIVEMSGMMIHIIRRQPNGPILIGQQIEYGENVRTRIQELSEPDRNELVTRVREALMRTPGVYGFQDENGLSVPLSEMQLIFLERRIYPQQADQQRLMDGLVGIWKAMRYLDDLPKLIQHVESRE
ncbi:MAG: DUF2299 family protein [Halalkalicoccus sp.]